MAKVKYITIDLTSDNTASVITALRKANLVSMVVRKPYVVIARFGVNKTTLKKKILKKI